MDISRQAETAALIFRFIEGHKDETFTPDDVSLATGVNDDLTFKILELLTELNVVKLMPSLGDELKFWTIPTDERTSGAIRVVELLQTFDKASSTLINTL